MTAQREGVSLRRCTAPCCTGVYVTDKYYTRSRVRVPGTTWCLMAAAYTRSDINHYKESRCKVDWILYSSSRGSPNLAAPKLACRLPLWPDSIRVSARASGNFFLCILYNVLQKALPIYIRMRSTVICENKHDGVQVPGTAV